tara:strand:- start:486 stop:923 length:438 start_codon:yes stop_codon:yes gene_type:complete
MATFNKVNDFVLNAVENMDLNSDQIVIALSNTAPASEASNPAADGNGILANVTEIAYTNLSSRNLTTATSSQTGGVYKLVVNDIVLTSTGGSTGPFRYIYLYDDTVASPVNPLVGYYDYGSSLTLNDSDSITVDFSPTNGVIQIT